MNKNLLKRIASVATELDQFGFTKEAKSLDLILLKLAQEEMDDSGPEKDEERPVEIDEDVFFEAYMGESEPYVSGYGNQEYYEDMDYF